MPLCFIFKSFIVLHVAKKLKKECERIARKVFGFFYRYIYIIAVVVTVVSFGWIRKKIKSSFLGDIRGKKKKKDGEENSFPCLVLFISNGMKQSGLRTCLDGGLWHWCSSRSVVKSVQVPDALTRAKEAVGMQSHHAKSGGSMPCKIPA